MRYVLRYVESYRKLVKLEDVPNVTLGSSSMKLYEMFNTKVLVENDISCQRNVMLDNDI